MHLPDTVPASNAALLQSVSVTGVVAVDLAARYSAGVWLHSPSQVLRQWDSAAVDEDTFLTECTWMFHGRCEADHLVVEDLPHGVSYRNLVKRVCQLQGRLVERMAGAEQLNRLLFVAPATWRNSYPALRKRGLGMEAVVPLAADLGYTPPQLDHLAGPRAGKALIRKVQTDYCAAYLISAWALNTYAEHQTLDVPGTARYAQPTRRKDHHAQDHDG